MNDKKFAILIDADNNSIEYIKTVIDEITNEGVITYKRMYGDWTSPNLQSYKDALLEFSITPMQQYSYTKGKNATDSAMIIDAMDILYQGDVDGFCLVSSDSDFTKLASRLREAGKIVIGMGREQTPKPFVKACNEFKYVDRINAEQKKPSAPQSAKSKSSKKKDKNKTAKAAEIIDAAAITDANVIAEANAIAEAQPKAQESEKNITPIEAVKSTIVKIIEERSDEDGWMLVSLLGSLLSRKISDFDTRHYGHKQLIHLLRYLNFETRSERNPNNTENPNGLEVYVKIKD